MKTIALIGYSGHAYVAFEIFFSQGMIVSAYTEPLERVANPFRLRYLGNETEPSVREALKNYSYFVAMGDNELRKKISEMLIPELGLPENALHKTAIISRSMNAGHGNMFAARVVVNPLVKIGNGVILNTACVIEHECVIGDYAHIAPGAVLCGDVHVGSGSFIGAGSVIRQGVRIGDNVMIGAGSVVVKNIPSNSRVVGNPQRFL
jgi:sugar O-acyltransferase (sialic acid O-acetyltransferase NeuD family)